MTETEASVLLESNLPGVELVARGKVRDVYQAGEHILFIASDRISAFDVVLPNGIPRKGEVLTKLSIFWFDLLKDVIPTHFVTANVDEYPAEVHQFRDQLEGLLPGQMDIGSMIKQCRKFGEVTGEIGDVLLLHPYMLHSSSRNPSGRPRFLINPPVSFKEPMNFNREDPADFSPVERTVLRALDVERLDFRIQGKRERVVPERVRQQKKMLAEQKERLAALDRG